MLLVNQKVIIIINNKQFASNMLQKKNIFMQWVKDEKWRRKFAFKRVRIWWEKFGRVIENPSAVDCCIIALEIFNVHSHLFFLIFISFLVFLRRRRKISLSKSHNGSVMLTEENVHDYLWKIPLNIFHNHFTFSSFMF